MVKGGAETGIPADAHWRETSSLAVGFAESQYGIVKRIVVILEWVAQIAEDLGKSSVTILDCGCGTGDYVTYPLARAGHDVLGLDVHTASIKEARERYALPNLTFRAGVVEDLVREARTFDVVICSEVLEHLHDPRGFLASLRRLVRPGGAVIVTTPNGYGAFEMLRRLERVLRRLGIHQLLRRIVRGDGAAAADPGFLNCDSVHVQFFRVRALQPLFRQSGFRVVARRSRTLLCGPYVDTFFHLCPGRQALLRVNNRVADLLPFSWAADWMFWLEPEGGGRP